MKLFAILSLTANVAFADPPRSNLYGADIVVDGKKESGYIGVFEMEPIDISKPDILSQARKYKKIGFVKDLVELKNLFKKEAHVKFGPLVSTSAPMRFIDTSAITKITRVSRPFDEAIYYGQIGFLERRKANLLATKEPSFVCAAAYSESPSLYWVSYSSKTGKDQLDPICNSIEPPSDKLSKAILKDPHVFTVTRKGD